MLNLPILISVLVGFAFSPITIVNGIPRFGMPREEIKPVTPAKYQSENDKSKNNQIIKIAWSVGCFL